jgi:hypothetical protein
VEKTRVTTGFFSEWSVGSLVVRLMKNTVAGLGSGQNQYPEIVLLLINDTHWFATFPCSVEN